MKIILISMPHHYDNELEILIDLFKNGLEIFHLRKPAFSLKETIGFIEDIPKIFQDRIMLHYHHSLLAEHELKGMHFTETQRTSDYDQIVNIRERYPRLHLSSSFHRIDDIKESGGIFDYLFLSPVFNSISKKNYKAAFNQTDLKTFLKTTSSNILALGGVNENNINIVRNLGFYGAGVLGAVWSDKHPVAAYLRIKKATEAI